MLLQIRYFKNGKDIGMKVTETFKLIWKSNLLVSFSVDSIDHLCLNQLDSLKLTPSSSSLPSKVNRKSTPVRMGLDFGSI